MSDLLLLRFDSADLPEDERFRSYASAMVNFDVERMDAAPFRAAAKVWRVGGLVVAHVQRRTPLLYTRNALRIAQDDADHFYINLHARGWVKATTGRGVARGGAGSLLAIDMRQPCSFMSESRSQVSIAIPRRLLAPRLHDTDPHGVVAEGGMVPLLGRTLEAIVASLDEMDLSHGEAIERLIVDLVAETLTDAMRSPEGRRAGDAAIVDRARAYMEARLAEAIDVATICDGLGVSRSRLYRAFGDRGGVLRQLQQCRLRRMRALLENPGETRAIGELATLCGFASKAHFARSFRREHGLTPGAYRAQCLKAALEPPAASIEAARAFGETVRALS
jgi:AraC-like DNA-binding protein